VQPVKGALLGEALGDEAEDRHLPSGPGDAFFPISRQLAVCETSNSMGTLLLGLRLDGGFQIVDLVRPFPGEPGPGAAEVAVGRGLEIDRTEQVEVLDDPLGGEGEHFADGFGELVLADGPVPKVSTMTETGSATPDGGRRAGRGTSCELRRHQVLGHVAAM